jgi:hypothetical protein
MYSIYIYSDINRMFALLLSPFCVMVMGRQSYTTCRAMAHLGLTLGWKVGDRALPVLPPPRVISYGNVFSKKNGWYQSD